MRIVPIFRLTFRSMAEVLAEARAMYARAEAFADSCDGLIVIEAIIGKVSVDVQRDE